MDAFDESYNEEGSAEGPAKFGWIAVILGVLGLALGITGVIMANKANRELVAMQAELAEKPDRVPELQAEIQSVSERLERLGSEFVKLNRQDRSIQENTQKAFTSVTRDMRENRDALNQLTERFTELSEKLESRTIRQPVQPSQEPEAVSGDESGEPAAPTNAAQNAYQVQSGDTLSRIASKFGISLNDLMEANPAVNPRALQIGQSIQIPEP